MTEPADQAGTLRQAAGWLFWATIVIVVDFRVAGGADRVGIDLINDVVGAALVLPGIARLRHAATTVADTEPWRGLAWAAALVHVPLVLAEEVTLVAGLGDLEHTAVELLSTVASLGGTFCAAVLFERCLRALGGYGELADRWRRTGWWVLAFGGVPAVLTVLAPAVGLVEPDDRGGLIALFAGAAILGAAALAFGLIALIGLLTTLSRTRQLADIPPPPPNASGAITS